MSTDAQFAEFILDFPRSAYAWEVADVICPRDRETLDALVAFADEQQPKQSNFERMEQ